MAKGLPRSLKYSALSREAAGIAALAGTAGTADGTIAEVTAIDTSDTYTDAAVNAKLTIINNNFADLRDKVNAIIAALQAD